MFAVTLREGGGVSILVSSFSSFSPGHRLDLSARAISGGNVHASEVTAQSDAITHSNAKDQNKEKEKTVSDSDAHRHADQNSKAERERNGNADQNAKDQIDSKEIADESGQSRKEKEEAKISVASALGRRGKALTSAGGDARNSSCASDDFLSDTLTCTAGLAVAVRNIDSSVGPAGRGSAGTYNREILRAPLVLGAPIWVWATPQRVSLLDAFGSRCDRSRPDRARSLAVYCCTQQRNAAGQCRRVRLLSSACSTDAEWTRIPLCHRQR